MKFVYKGILILSIIISGMIQKNEIFLQSYEVDNENYSLGLSNSNSWSRIVKEGGRIYPPYCELVNGSLYLIGRLISEDKSKYIYVSKFSTTGTIEWETMLETQTIAAISYAFDSENNLFILFNEFNFPFSAFVKIDSTGKLLFSKELTSELHSFNSLLLGQNNSVLILGYYSGLSLFIMNFNNDGHHLWNFSFNLDYYDSLISPVRDSGNNMYFSFRNNSIDYIAKINGSGAIEWQKKLEYRINRIFVGFDDSLYLLGKKNLSTGYILKLNSFGNQSREITIKNYNVYFIRAWYLNDLLVYHESSMWLLCYDTDLNLKWNSSFSNYLSSHGSVITSLVKDLQGNIYIAQQTDDMYKIILVKVSSTGNVLSKIEWGGGLVPDLGSFTIDLENNLYFTCNCRVWALWKPITYTVFVKNPVNGGVPPVPKLFLEFYVGLSCVLSLIVLFSILIRNKKRTGRFVLKTW